jgi:guanylate kinase
MKKHVLVICGTSGSGKTTVKEYLVQQKKMIPVLTHTTRTQRPGESDDAYHFETQTSFFEKHYLEYVKYDGNYYGSSYEALQEAFNKGDWAVIVLDTKGALSYLEKLPTNTVVLYLQVSDKECLQQRLLKRGDTLKAVKKRLDSLEAKRDQCLPQALASKAYILENDQWQQTVQKLDEWLATL